VLSAPIADKQSNTNVMHGSEPPRPSAQNNRQVDAESLSAPVSPEFLHINQGAEGAINHLYQTLDRMPRLPSGIVYLTTRLDARNVCSYRALMKVADDGSNLTSLLVPVLFRRPGVLQPAPNERNANEQEEIGDGCVPVKVQMQWGQALDGWLDEAGVVWWKGHVGAYKFEHTTQPDGLKCNRYYECEDQVYGVFTEWDWE
jgi:hypothetical protein